MHWYVYMAVYMYRSECIHKYRKALTTMNTYTVQIMVLNNIESIHVYVSRDGGEGMGNTLLP